MEFWLCRNESLAKSNDFNTNESQVTGKDGEIWNFHSVAGLIGRETRNL